MEQKRTLWIIAAAGMFLLVVLGAAFILYSPAQKCAPQTIAQNFQVPPQGFQQPSSGWQSVPGAYNGNQLLPPSQGEIHTNDLTVYTENTKVYGTETSEGTVIDLNALKAATEMAPAQESVPQPQNINITVNLPETKIETVPAPVVAVTDVPVRVVQAEPAKRPASSVAPAAPATSSKTTVKPAPKAESKPAAAPVKQAPAKPAVSQYWVQAAAYSNKKTAENARAVLDDNKIPADIFTYQDAKGKVFYRVRVGPYTTKSEAEYWRTKIEKISEFSKAESYITMN
ncbi:MAG: SPOR domain-containing protein [Treponema sp.]|nr:SPOR domain-containing protein [Treponema sp.]